MAGCFVFVIMLACCAAISLAACVIEPDENGHVNYPEGESVVPAEAFKSCGALKSIALPLTAKSVGRYAFQSCKSLTSVSLPAATSIDIGAFQSCTSLTS
eukprot:CAMPEP_0174707574 /NCGR_PEP_ID=MMETSP1094-20130205/10054_1 /TAXON_ID=156173 /ORGANISM="Chrysochromulina brevifilum, Strain UTEX LB 985" /LENGTH=99 /DNA_ID=CAMNT_0015905977 /DNA_START=37 /DNA_END=332 /DNA_ORIENTATION=+